MAASTFVDIARRQQASFRSTLTTLVGQPHDDKSHRHGHLLPPGCHEENLHPTLRGPAGAPGFFAARGIQWHRTFRSGDAKGQHGPTRNLASSQVCCVNFLLPLAGDPVALTELLRGIDADVVGVDPIVHQGRSSLVEFEWVGFDGPLEGGRRVSRGANQTSADALIVARTRTGRRAYVIEWKYVEAYRSPEDLSLGPEGVTRQRRYQHLYDSPTSAFNGTAPFKDWLWEPFYQLMRLRLLADRMVARGVTEGQRVDEARVVVVCPKANNAYRLAVQKTPLAARRPPGATVEDIVRTTLKDPASLTVVAQDDLVAHLRGSLVASGLSSWLAYHSLRYGW